MRGQNVPKEKRRGQTVVEFALILPILLLIALGLIEFGRAFFVYSVVSNAAREGARYGMVHPRDPDGMRDAAYQRVLLVPTDTVTIDVHYDTGDPAAPFNDPDLIEEGVSRVVVDVTHDFTMMTPLFQPLFPATTINFISARTVVAGARVRKTPATSTPPPPCTVPLTGVTINGPGSGNSGENLTFTANVAPADATTPISYNWSTDGLLSGQGTATAVYRWSACGTHVVQLSSGNCGGTAVDDQSVDIGGCGGGCDFPLLGVVLSGPTSGEVNQDLNFSVSPDPAGATTPITYDWSDDGLISGEGTTAAVYRWGTTGQRTVTVTGINCGGVLRSDSQLVEIGPAGCPSPLTGVAISGPASGETNQDLVFNALIDPAGATTPINYTWSTDGLVGGQGSAQATYNWSTTGLQTIDVTVDNCGGAYSFSDDHEVDISPPAGTTLVINFAANYPCRGEEQNVTKGRIRVIAYVTDEYGFPITDANVTVQIAGGESGTLSHNSAGYYGDGAGACWASTDYKYGDGDVTVTATKAGYTSGNATETTSSNPTCDGACP
ncbi:MAG: pilus assembly protein [Chloroflexia bacterium]|nr:pilus assembly protein [Chloroflexia bacterium]